MSTPTARRLRLGRSSSAAKNCGGKNCRRTMDQIYHRLERALQARPFRRHGRLSAVRRTRLASHKKECGAFRCRTAPHSDRRLPGELDYSSAPDRRETTASEACSRRSNFGVQNTRPDAESPDQI
jgi:hypothetical protein